MDKNLTPLNYMAKFIVACRLLFEQNLRNENTQRHNATDGMQRYNLHVTFLLLLICMVIKNPPQCKSGFLVKKFNKN